MRESGISLKQCLIGFISAAVLTALDQLTKIWAVNRLSEGPIDLIPGIFQFRYLENHGAAFGILQNQQWFFYLITAAFLCVIIYVYVRIPADRKYRLLRILCIVLTAGAVGNLIDRVSLHYVRDFLYFIAIDFPIFNVADIYVTCGAAVLFISIMFIYQDEDFDFLKKKEKI